MRLWNKFAQDLRVIKILVAANCAQFIAILGLLICLMTIPTRMVVYIPPDLSNGATLHINQASDSQIGDFSMYTWQVLNDWQDNGSVDAPRNLQEFGAFVSPEFYYKLNDQIKSMEENGELQGRVKEIEPVEGVAPQVTKVSEGRWNVILTVREKEYVNGVLIKDKEIQYPLRVKSYTGNFQLNPQSLQFDGFFSDPQILKTVK